MEVINVCSVLDELFPNNSWFDALYSETSQSVKNWCNSNNAYFYSRGRENFSISEAVRLAEVANKSKVVVEDLS